jgi:hypothetical protein
MAGQLQNLEAQGELVSRSQELNKVSTLMGMSGQRLQAANEARNAATEGILAGVGGAIGGAAALGIGDIGGGLAAGLGL